MTCFKIFIAAATLMLAAQAFDVKAPTTTRPGRLIDSSLNFVDDSNVNDDAPLSMASFLAPAATAEITASTVQATFTPTAGHQMKPKKYDLPAHHYRPLLVKKEVRPNKILEDAEVMAGRLSIFAAVMMLTCEIASGQSLPDMIAALSG
mmetsp:Transcript_20323/g.43998  ORF Transcript_20323/g.43998 Transcript_20323/m.43998 type:complete len:149 (-) Transcript_20323:908-1354(-)|eukprot:CAMPEP_0168757942 /NCGR_PEP_ID=MMETSP0724-20121128/21437_1 /TAXON_ID=265536 /ORGANISM="Amphiprora sp., Strain CCMP467" /LENGTH=148 /DNA_ID=CAMNT_0008806789 /DNA_START=20 /DNA_END=466 /DNA_ORIENTATION=+